jgi:hypothetical protein
MMIEDANLPAWQRHFVEKTGRYALDPLSQMQKLSFSFSRRRSLIAGKLIHRRAADLAVDDLGPVIHHYEREHHPAGVVAYCPAPRERHQSSNCRLG